METTTFTDHEQEEVSPSERPVKEEQAVAEQPDSENENQREPAPDAPGKLLHCCKSVRDVVAQYLDNSQRIGHHVLELHEQASQWIKATPYAPLLTSQHDFLRRWFDGSVDTTRALWQLGTKRTSAKKIEPGATAS